MDHDNLLNILAKVAFGRELVDGLCVCHGEPVDDSSFRDDTSRREYQISRLCQRGQDEMFGVQS